MNAKKENLTQEQKRYAIRRVDDIVFLKLKGINESDYKTKDFSFDPDKKFRLFKQGKYTFMSENPFKSYNTMKMEVICDGEVRGGMDWKKYEEAKQEIVNRGNAIKDKIMLGDAKQALKMIADFEK